MTETGGKGSYFYPNDSNDPDRTDVLRNRFGIRSHSELRVEEYRATAFRMAEIAEGDGPAGNFDKAHLKAIHKHIFQDVFEWAGHTRNESPIVEGQRVEPIGHFSKAGDHFLHGSRVEMGLDQALKPIADPDVLRGSSIDEFAAKAGVDCHAILPLILLQAIENKHVKFIRFQIICLFCQGILPLKKLGALTLGEMHTSQPTWHQIFTA